MSLFSWTDTSSSGDVVNGQTLLVSNSGYPLGYLAVEKGHQIRSHILSPIHSPNMRTAVYDEELGRLMRVTFFLILARVSIQLLAGIVEETLQLYWQEGRLLGGGRMRGDRIAARH